MMKQMTQSSTFFLRAAILSVLGFVLLFASEAFAATLKLSPETGVYTAGNTFTARVLINTAGQPVNAAEGKLSFNPRELSVVNVSRSSSIFNLWTQEPSYSNSGGTITFGGGSPSGYTGSAGTVMTVTFRATAAGSPKVTFSEGSVLAADGLGTNVLTSMKGGSYTIAAKTEQPAPEYIPPANTPGAPKVTSTTHPDQNAWYTNTTAEVSWSLPSGITAVRTILDSSPSTIPTKLYETPIDSLTIEDLDEGVSYLHVQLKNADGWGRVTHYRLAVDTENPSKFDITLPEDADPSNPTQTLIFDVEDATSPVTRYMVRLDGAESVEYLDEEETGQYTLPTLDPGTHSVVVEAFDGAGNSIVSTFEFSILSFDKPVFTEYPTKINDEVIPVIKGSTRPNAEVTVTVARVGGETTEYQVTSGENGEFAFIPDSTFSVGVYDLVAVAKDEYGAKSDSSDSIRIAVEVPGYVKIGSFVVSLLSIVVPTIALLILLTFGVWYLWHRLILWRRKVKKEAVEAAAVLAHEFDDMTKSLASEVTKLKKSRKGKLTKAEGALIDQIDEDIKSARARIKKEITDIENIVK